MARVRVEYEEQLPCTSAAQAKLQPVDSGHAFKIEFYLKHINIFELYEWLDSVALSPSLNTALFVQRFSVAPNTLTTPGTTQYFDYRESPVHDTQDDFNLGFRSNFEPRGLDCWFRVEIQGDAQSFMYKSSVCRGFFENVLWQFCPESVRRKLCRVGISMNDKTMCWQQSPVPGQGVSHEHWLQQLHYVIERHQISLDASLSANAKFESLKENYATEKIYSHDRMCKLACEFGIHGGHWTVYAQFNVTNQQSAQEYDDQTWRLLVKSFLTGELGDSAANGIRYKRTLDGLSFSVSNPTCAAVSFPNRQQAELWDKNDSEVFSVEKAIRRSGLARTMKYKADIYSCCYILHTMQPRALRPTLYKSTLLKDSVPLRSEISTNYTPDYMPDVDFGANTSYYNQLPPSLSWRQFSAKIQRLKRGKLRVE